MGMWLKFISSQHEPEMQRISEYVFRGGNKDTSRGRPTHRVIGELYGLEVGEGGGGGEGAGVLDLQ